MLRAPKLDSNYVRVVLRAIVRLLAEPLAVAHPPAGCLTFGAGAIALMVGVLGLGQEPFPAEAALAAAGLHPLSLPAESAFSLWEGQTEGKPA